MKYTNWDHSFELEKDENGELHAWCGPGLAWHEKEYVGKGLPSACQAKRQKLILGDYNCNTIFGIKAINHSYNDWTGNPFEDYEIDILQGTEEEVIQCIRSNKHLINCDECCGCGDW